LLPVADARPNGSQLLLTKGDNNARDDYDLYRGPEWLDGKLVVGKVQG
jgi:signal peptidase